MERSRFLYVTWERLFDDTLTLGEMISSSGYGPDFLVVIARGGWIIGRILVDHLGVKEVRSLMIQSYGSVGEKGEPRIVQGFEEDLSGRKVLIVDDISDTGETLEVAVNHARSLGAEAVKTAVLYVKPWTGFVPDYYVSETDKWVIFPYEHVETLESLVKLLEKEGIVEKNRVKEFLVEIGFNSSRAEYFLSKVMRKGRALKA